MHDVPPSGIAAVGHPVSPKKPTVIGSRSWIQRTGVRLIASPQGKIGLLILGAFTLAALLAPILAPYNPLTQFNGQELQSPSSAHLFGTDEFGRDILSRILYGSQISFTVGLASVFLGASIGVGSGLIAGYLHGIVEAVIMRIWDAMLAFPGILTGVAVVTLLGPGLLSTVAAAGILTMPGFARLAASVMTAERNKEYVMAAQSVGVPTGRIIFRHILPNSLGPLLVHAALSLATAIFLEAAMSFLGLGSQPPAPSWGSMLSESRQYLQIAPYYALFPGIAISALLVGLNSLADGLRDALDPTALGRL